MSEGRRRICFSSSDREQNRFFVTSLLRMTLVATARDLRVQPQNRDAERALNVRPLAMTGAYVDGDDVVDLLIGTYRGELIAISGATLKVLWQVQFDGPVGPAVATDIYGDGRGEVVLITGDGRLRVLASK